MRLRGRTARPERSRSLRIFFCTDVHGSDQCFRKFLNAGDFYDVDHLILGGDMTGKILVPITRMANGGYSCRFDEHTYSEIGDTELGELCRSIRAQGEYPFVGTSDEVAALADPAILDREFRRLVYDAVADWVQLAEDRLGGTGRRCFMAPGNDDFLDIDEALTGSPVVEFAEAKCIVVDGHEMITTGYSNPTPWATERELPETDLRSRIDGMAANVSDFSNLICVLHAPPYASEIDAAPAIDEELSLRGGASGVQMIPVGSTAVRSFIEDFQPLVGLHGHVHEGRGAARLGRTLCINPGSEYTEGTLAGVIVELSNGSVVRHQFVAG